MSMDLIIFDPKHLGCDAGMIREKLGDCRFSRHACTEDSNDPANLSPSLREFFEYVIRTYPPLNGPLSVSKVDYGDYEAVCDYELYHDHVLILCPWSVAADAAEFFRSCALQRGLGVYHISLEGDVVECPENGDALEHVFSTVPEQARRWARRIPGSISDLLHGRYVEGYRDLANVLRRQGWRVARDETGDMTCSFDLEDRQVEFCPVLKRGQPYHGLEMLVSITLPELNAIAAKIAAKKKGFVPAGQKHFELRKRRGLRERDVTRFLQTVLEWARRHDVEAEIAQWQRLPTDTHGARPVYLLAALAHAGNVEKLQHFLESFERGDRLGFVPYITTDYIERALSIARERAGR